MVTSTKPDGGFGWRTYLCWNAPCAYRRNVTDPFYLCDSVSIIEAKQPEPVNSISLTCSTRVELITICRRMNRIRFAVR
jgi:hypothetical protein